MFDVSFWELATVGVVALVVIGPERLPKVARTAGHLFGRMQRYVATVKADINREMEMSELAKVKQEVQDAARSFEHSIQEHASSIENEAAKIQQTTEQALRPEAAAAPAAKAALPEPSGAPEASPAATAPAPPASEPVTQMSFDFGVEPPRKR